MKHSFRFRSFFIPAVLISAVLLSSCRQSRQPLRPIAVALLYDMSLSAAQNGIPELDREDIERLLGLLKKRGGVLAFCEITGRSRVRPLRRIRLEAVAGNLEERALANTRNESELADFRSQIEASLGPRNARKSDVLGALSRAALFFNEPLIAQMERVLIIISDGAHDAAALPAPELPANIVVIAIGLPPQLAEQYFATNEVVIFESIDGALSYLETPQDHPKQQSKGEQ